METSKENLYNDGRAERVNTQSGFISLESLVVVEVRQMGNPTIPIGLNGGTTKNSPDN